MLHVLSVGPSHAAFTVEAAMATMKKFHSIVGEKPAQDAEAPSVDDPNVGQIRADDKEAAHAPANAETNNEEANPSDGAQAGVKKIEAVTLSWTRGTAYAILVLYVSLPLIAAWASHPKRSNC